MTRLEFLIALVLTVREAKTQKSIADFLNVPPSQVNRSMGGLKESRLLDRDGRARRRAIHEFAVHGAKYIFPATLGQRTLGIATSICSPLFDDAESRITPLVWPTPLGQIRGAAIQPIHAAAPGAALRDDTLYRVLAALDAVRLGEARDVEYALPVLDRLLKGGQG